MKSARYLFVAVMGTWMGLAGVEHGVGEILQGRARPTGLLIQSWPDSAFFASLNGEPAITVLPDLLFTGILAVAISLLYITWAIFLSRRKHGWLAMMLLAVPMLLFGGGLFPPVLAALVGAAARGLNNPGVVRPANRLSQTLAKAWPFIFAACCLGWLLLLPGVPVLSYFFVVDDTGLTLAIMTAAFSLMFIAWWSGKQYDRYGRSRP